MTDDAMSHERLVTAWVRVLPGHWPGVAGPCVWLQLPPTLAAQAAVVPPALDRVFRALSALGVGTLAPHEPPPQVLPAAQAVCWRMLRWLGAWQTALGVPLVDGPHPLCMAHDAQGVGTTSEPGLALATPAAVASAALLRQLLALLERAVVAPAGVASDKVVLTPAEQSQWRRWADRMASHAPVGSNNAHLLRAARALGLPVRHLARDRFQLGWGRRARWLQSTLTDATPSLGVQTARDKALTHQLLGAAGVPVPRQVEVGGVRAAVAAATRLGFPVVVKPADRDGGVGARAGLKDAQAVALAYEQARRMSRRVLVEQHLSGHEFRLTVVHGRLFWAHQRVPAQVTGDGASSLQALVNRENLRRRASPGGGLRSIAVDAEMLGYLQEQGLSMLSVPGAGESVRLQRVPAAFTGGDGRAFTETIHPDNAWLAERAAALLRMDVAGVDLIMPDVTRSWREVGGGITEVNAIPQISNLTQADLHQRLLQRLVPGDGRVPMVVVLAGQASDAPWLAALLDRLESSGLTVGLSTPQALTLGGRWVRGPRASVFDDVQLLQLDPLVGVVVVLTDAQEFATRTGLPFDRLDVLVRTTAVEVASPAARWLGEWPCGPVLDASPEAGEAWVEEVVTAVLAADWVHSSGARLRMAHGPDGGE